MCKKSICIVAHRYIPFEGVNAIRWINLSKELAKCGFDVTVITVRRSSKKKLDRPQHYQLKISYSYSDPFYRLIEWFPSNYFLKIIKFIILKFCTLIWTDDYAQYWASGLEKSITHWSKTAKNPLLIATGGPFQACLHSAKICKNLKIPFVADFQDPWFFDKLSKSSPKLESKRINNHNFIVNNSLARFYVTTGLADLYRDHSNNTFIVENAHSFDNTNLVSQPNEIFHIVYFGTLSNGRDIAFIQWLNSLEMNAGIDVALVIDVYGRISNRFSQFLWMFNRRNSLITINSYPVILRDNITTIANKYNAALQINAKEYPYLVSMKIYEYPALGLPTLSINYGGLIDSMIKQSRIGFSLDLSDNKIYKLSEIILILSNVSNDSLAKFKKNNSWEVRAHQIIRILMLL